ncbi:helicase-related protein, partial [Psychrobacter sp.]|uniref:helicase-related protein n=1 Tax=Psychrobacter sp. TaxID=56811 RepID=UPI0025ED3951
QHVQNIGAKKKTLFVVPNSVLSNWRKEANFAYQNTDDCLFVGLREKDGKFKVYSNKYDEDLVAAIDGKYRKIFMTFEAFRRIRLKDDSIEGYAKYLKQTDSAYEDQELKKDDEKAKGLVAQLIDNIKINSSAPFLEDMNVDSVVVDEAHAFKNSITAPKTDDRVKYLSLAGTSDRGEDAQAKLWYIRSGSKNNDGVQLLSATPITNSPLEIYSMLSLAAGRDVVNNMSGGVKGADEFLQLMCQIEEEVVPTIDGRERSQNVFTGIRNVQALNHAIKSTATVKDASDVGLSVVIPEREEKATKIDLSPDNKALLETYQLSYQVARAMSKEPPQNWRTGDEKLDLKMQNAYNEVKALFNEPDELMGHPFNLIRKMDVLIADSDFSKQATFYDFDSAQKKLAESAIEKFNKKPSIDERSRLSVFTDPDDTTEVYTKDGDQKVLSGYKVKVKAKIVIDSGRERIVIDTLNSKLQSNFEDIADKEGLKLDVTISAKVAAMLDNFKNEQANPRGVNSDGTNSKIIKQIIFCDHLFLHNKIKKLLTQQAGIPASKITIITGQINNEPDQMINIQDGFNAESDDNQYQVIIANQKAEVGINLQIGTQAIHHLTTGWTPDSLEQRNGRGARQGNKTDKVTIYHYDADGTFDEFKRTMINKKDEWIGSVLENNGKNTVAVTGGISKEDQEALIAIGGDKTAIAQYQANKEKRENQLRIESAKRNQNINLTIIEEQKQFLANTSPHSLYNDDILSAVEVIRSNMDNLKKSEDAKKSKQTQDNYAKKYAAAKDIAVKKLQKILESIEINAVTYDAESKPTESVGAPKITAEDLYSLIEKNSGQFKPSDKDSTRSYGSRESSFRNILVDKGYAKEVIIKDDSDYQSEYEQAKQTAENMIEQSGLAIDEISREAGGLPIGAGSKIAKGEAMIVKESYIEPGTFIVVNGRDAELLLITDDNLDIWRLRPNGNAYTTSLDLGYGESLNKVVLPTDPDYLEYVKKAAAIEDQLYVRDELDDPIYSRSVPAVADYRDGNAQIAYDIKPGLFSQPHIKLSCLSLPFILPVSVLSKSTDLAKKALADYNSFGININLEEGRFTIDKDSKVEKEGELQRYGDGKTIVSSLKDYIIYNNTPISTDDDYSLTSPETLSRLLDIEPGVREQMDTDIKQSFDLEREAPYEQEDFLKIANDMFDKYVFNPSLVNRDVINDVDLILGLVLRQATRSDISFGTDKIRALYQTALRHKTLTDGAKALEELLSDSTAIKVIGNTYQWKDDIKEYASTYGSNVRGDKKYFWDKRNQCWVISYKAYVRLIEDKPSAKNDLNFEKAS